MVSCVGSLVQSCLGEGDTADKCHRPVWGGPAVFRPHWVCPPLRACMLPHLHCSGSRLLYRGRALSCVHFPGPSYSGSGFRVLHKDADSVGPAFCAFPAQAAQAARSLTGTLSPGESTSSPLRSQPQFPCAPVWCALCPFWEADFWLRPSRQMSTIQNLRSLWLEAGSLFAIW